MEPWSDLDARLDANTVPSRSEADYLFEAIDELVQKKIAKIQENLHRRLRRIEKWKPVAILVGAFGTVQEGESVTTLREIQLRQQAENKIDKAKEWAKHARSKAIRFVLHDHSR